MSGMSSASVSKEGTRMRSQLLRNTLLLVAAMNLPVTAGAQSSLPKEVQADLLQNEIIAGLESGDLSAAKSSLAKYRALKVEMPLVLILIEAKIAISEKNYETADKRLSEYLEKGGREAPAYQEVLIMYKKVSTEIAAEKERKKQSQREKAAELAAQVTNAVDACNDATSCYNLGKLQATLSKPTNTSIMQGSFEKACNFGNYQACEFVGNFYIDGYVSRKMAKKLGSSNFHYSLKEDIDTGEKFLEKACENNLKSACHAFLFDQNSFTTSYLQKTPRYSRLLKKMCFELSDLRTCEKVGYPPDPFFSNLSTIIVSVQYAIKGCDLGSWRACMYAGQIYRDKRSLNNKKLAKKYWKRACQINPRAHPVLRIREEVSGPCKRYL